MSRSFVYIIASYSDADQRSYVGWTNDLDKRLEAHNNGRGAKSTRGRRWVLLYAECLPGRREAMSREWHLKRNRTFRRQLLTDCLDTERQKP